MAELRIAGDDHTRRPPPDAGPHEEPPLAVDLDGTLIRTDLLWESLVELLRRSPLLLFVLPYWLTAGKAGFKRRIAERVELDPETLPYSDGFVDYLRRENASGRTLVLATASDAKLAEAVSKHLGLFKETLASNHGLNLSGETKRDALVEHFGAGGFDYAGNSARDFPVWASARRAIVVNAPTNVAGKVGRLAPVAVTFPAPPFRLHELLRALRVHQWLKNALVFVPLLTAHLWGNAQAVLNVVIAFVAFSLVASSMYLVNDLGDLRSDRRHIRKRNRALASGAMPIPMAIVLIACLLLAGIGLAATISLAFCALLIGYGIMTCAYTLSLKTYVLIDVFVLAALYTVRVIGGVIVVGTGQSFWLLAFSQFLFLSLALIKRCAELQALSKTGQPAVVGRDYRATDLSVMQAIGVSCGVAAVLVLALYINSQEVAALYLRPWVLWLAAPPFLYWIGRLWIKTSRGEMLDDPLTYAIRDRASCVCLVAIISVVFAAA